MLRRTPLALASALLLSLALVTGATPSASAATTAVTIRTIAGQKAKWHHKVTIRPRVSVQGHVVEAHPTLTVKKGSKTVARNKTSAKLRAGRYKVTTKVTYRTWRMVTHTETHTVQSIELAAFTPVTASCTVTGETPDPTVPPVEGEAPTAYDLQLTCTSGTFTGAQQVEASAVSDGVGGWLVAADGASPEPVTLTPSFVDQVLDTTVVFDHDLTRTETVTTTREEKVTSKKKTKTRTQKLRITEGKRPSRTDPVSAYHCPSWAPIKGNASSMIYHLPGQRFYKVTKPEDCFSTQSAARKAGYRKSKV